MQSKGGAIAAIVAAIAGSMPVAAPAKTLVLPLCSGASLSIQIEDGEGELPPPSCGKACHAVLERRNKAAPPRMGCC